MELPGFFSLSLAVQVALGAGYLAYVTAYAGFRHSHSTQDTVFITLCFAVVASLTFTGVGSSRPLLATLLATTASLCTGILWRVVGRHFWHWLMRSLKVHRDDGVHNSWTAIVQEDREVGQLSVHLTDGRILYLSNRLQFQDAPWEGLYLGGNGGIIMIVEKERRADGTLEIREDIVDDAWGTRLTYLPAGVITRVNIRMK